MSSPMTGESSVAVDEQRSPRLGVADALIWLGGGDTRAVLEPRERSADTLAGVIVLITAALAWLVSATALTAAPQVPTGAAIAVGLFFALLVGVVSRAVAGGSTRSVPALAGRALGALAVGVIVGELASLVLFSGSIQRRIDEQAVLTVQSVPAVAQAAADLDRVRASRAELDSAVDQARTRRDEALVVARCEYNPSPDCPQTQITGVPGTGPETRTANAMLADAQQELDLAVAERTERAAGLDDAIGAGEQTLAQARVNAAGDPDRGLGARWIAMNDLTMTSAETLMLRLAAIGFFELLMLLPLILRLWRGETAHDRILDARVRRDIADLDAETAIAVKQAEVRAKTETLWAEQELADARLAAEAQYEINREHHRRRVIAAGGSVAAGRGVGTTAEREYLPIAAAARAASQAASDRAAAERVAAELRAVDPAAVDPAESGPGTELATTTERPNRRPLVPGLANVASVANLASMDNVRSAARWITPLVPQIVGRAIDTTKQPLRAARQAFEEVEEITFSFRRVHKVTVDSEQRGGESAASSDAVVGEADRGWVDSQFHRPARTDGRAAAGSARGAAIGGVVGSAAALSGHADRPERELGTAADPRALREAEGPLGLPPGDRDQR
jgi:hypothetical protein